MSKRQIGKCEAVYRAIPSLHLQEANIACTFVQSGFPVKQTRFLRKVNSPEPLKTNDIPLSESDSEMSDVDGSIQQADMQEDNLNNDNLENERLIQISGRKGVYLETERIMDKYASRPDGVENLTLSQFATSYAKCRKKPKKIYFNASGVQMRKEKLQII